MTTATQPDLRDTMFRVEVALARVVAATRGLRVEARPAVAGPFTLSYPVHLGAYQKLPEGALATVPATAEHIRRFMALGPAFAEAIRRAGVELRGAVRVADVEGHGLVVEVPSPSPWLPGGRQLAGYTSGLRVCVGIDQWKQPTTVDLTHTHGLGFIGTTGSGKTLAARAVVYGLARANRPTDLVYLIMAEKSDDWRDLARANHCLGLAATPGEMRAAASWAVEQMRQRNREGVSIPAIVVVLDDAHEAFNHDATLGRILSPLWTTGRGRGVIPFFISQSAGSTRAMGDSITEDNMRARIQFKTTSSTAAAKAAGRGGSGLHLLSGQTGDASLDIDGVRRRIATAWLTDTSDLDGGDAPPTPAWREVSPSLSPGGATRVTSPASRPPVTGDSDSDTLPQRTARGPLTAEDRAAIRARFHLLGSATAVAESYFGARNGRNVRLVADVLREGGNA